MKLCISVAVSKAERLPPLPGAINASDEVVAWARAAGFEATAVNDEAPQAQVSVQALRDIMVPLLGDTRTVIDHLVFHFAGHGVARGAEDQLLLLSNWRTRLDEAISVARFVRLLQYYQPKRVSLLIDACRTTDLAGDLLNGSGILDLTDEAPQEFLEDRFRAAAEGQASYMIRGPGGGEHCLFSSVLVHALCGRYPEAVAARDSQSVVTSGTIYACINHHFPREAARYGVRVRPSLKPQFLSPDDVYTTLPIAHAPRPLPTPGRVDAPIGASPRGPAEPVIVSSPARRAPRYAEEIRPTHFETGTGLAVVGIHQADLTLGAGSAAVHERPSEDVSWWRILPGTVQGTNSLAVQLEGGLVVGSAIIPGMIATISIAGRNRSDFLSAPDGVKGPTSVIFRSSQGWAPQDEVDVASQESERVIGRVWAGELGSDEALSIAIGLRRFKHVNPMLGVVAAYLYDASGDRDSIRRLAWYYTQFYQPIPFDIALLAGLRLRRDAGGRLLASLPAVASRAPRTEDEARHPELLGSTTPVEDASVAGGFPWLRQGWSLLDLASISDSGPLVELQRGLAPFPFTALTADYGLQLIQLIREGRA